MTIEDKIRKALMKHGMGSTLVPIRCPSCNFLASTPEEEEQLFRKKAQCPHCGVKDKIAQITLDNYILVCDWIGQFATSSNHRDQVSATIMFCVLFESILETLKRDYISIHPEIDSRIKDTEKTFKIKDVFGKTLIQLLDSAPLDIKQFPDEWETIRIKRNNFMHGHSGYLYLNQKDAQDVMDLTPKAIALFIWMNNKYCLRS